MRTLSGEPATCAEKLAVQRYRSSWCFPLIYGNGALLRRESGGWGGRQLRSDAFQLATGLGVDAVEVC